MDDSPAPSLATAHERWDAAWSSSTERADWLVPEPAVVATLPALRRRGADRVLDLGCGVGRHTKLFADAGFRTAALDGAPAGVARTAVSVPSAHVVLGSFEHPPFATATFSHVLAWNVVYHGDADVAAGALGEIARVLAPGGSLHATMLSARHDARSLGIEIRPDTWIDADGDDDKAHPHLYVDRDALLALHAPWFDLVTLEETEQRRPGAWHWEAWWVRRPGAPRSS